MREHRDGAGLVAAALVAALVGAGGCKRRGDAAPGATAAPVGISAVDAGEPAGSSIAPLRPASAPPADSAPSAVSGDLRGVGIPAGVETDGDVELPLRRTGLDSRAELDRGLEHTSSSAKPHLERGFRLCFTVRPEMRQYVVAEEELRKAIEIDPTVAEAYRALGYAVYNRSLNFDGAIPLYRKACELRPDYGEAHYALAFLLGTKSPAEGKDHFRKATELGIADELRLGPRFYPDVKQ
jgi:hypothetical protein